MKTLLVTVAALALTGGAALAQPQGDPNHQRNDRGGQGQGYQGGQGQSQSQSQGPAQSQGQQAGRRPDWSAYYRNNPDLQRAYKQNQRSPTYHESIEAFAERHYLEHGKGEGRALPMMQGAGQEQGQGQWRGGPWQNGGDRGHNADNRWQRYERNTSAQHRYDRGDYRWPRGYGYQRWTYGQFLPQVFFNESSRIYDYADYRLPYPPPGAAWVRYGPDALLIDRDTGEIIQVIYGVFY